MTGREYDLFGDRIISAFRGEHFWASMFYPSRIEMHNIVFPSGEHAYQWHKTLDPDERDWILYQEGALPGKTLRQHTTPGQAKSRGQQVTLRPNWELNKIPVMGTINRPKYAQNLDLRTKLLNTEESLLIEGNTWHDRFWGICNCPRCAGKGENWLGKILMQIREEFQRTSTGL